MKTENKSIGEVFGTESKHKIGSEKPQRLNYILGLITGILLTFLVFKLIPQILTASKISLRSPIILKESKTNPVPATSSSINPPDQSETVKSVLPDKVNLGVTLGNVVIKMVQNGAIDKEKFLSIYKERKEVTADDLQILDTPSNKEMVITPNNSGLLLNLLWPLGIANKTDVLSQGPIGTQYKDQVGNFASTGGWTLGKEDGGKLFNRFAIIPLTKSQEALVKEIAENIYRPCCGNSTYFPDCNHGAAMLGFIELAVSQGMQKEEIYKKALAINSYWFPQTYTELAVYFKNEKGITWDKVDAKTLLGTNYSSGKGYAAINKELQAKNLIPKVSTGGGGCGV